MGTTVGTFLIRRLASAALWARLWASRYVRFTFLIWVLGEIGNNSDFGGPNAVSRGLRFRENRKKRAHFVIFENRSFCREKWVETEQFAKWSILMRLVAHQVETIRRKHGQKYIKIGYETGWEWTIP